MTKNDFVRRTDLAKDYGVQDFYRAPDFGAILRRGYGKLSWWATNDQRRELVGVQPNQDLVQPTVGPFETFKQAYDAYVFAWSGVKR